MNILQKTPADTVAALERASTRRTTPNHEGEVVWHIWGTGKPLVLLHGGTGSWLHWVRNIEPLARDFMLVVPDIPGSGESGDPAMDHELLHQRAIDAARQVVFDMRETGEIGDDAYHRLEEEFDWLEMASGERE